MGLKRGPEGRRMTKRILASLMIAAAGFFMLAGTASAEIHLNVTDNFSQGLASDDWNKTHINLLRYEQVYDWNLKQWAWNLKKIQETPVDCGLNNWPPPPALNGCADWDGNATLYGQLPMGWYQIEVGARNHNVARQVFYVWEDNTRIDLEMMLQQSSLQIFTTDLPVTSLQLSIGILTQNTNWQSKKATLKIEVISPGKTSFDVTAAQEYQDIWVNGWSSDFRTVKFKLPLGFIRGVVYGSRVCVKITALSQGDPLKTLGEGEVCGYKRF